MNLTQALEQIEATGRDLAPIAGTYFKGLLNQGFTRMEALTLTVSWITTLTTPRDDGSTQEGK